MADTRAYGSRSAPIPATVVGGKPPSIPAASQAPRSRRRCGTAAGSLEGKQLRHFRVDRRIAEGGMGEVYRGFDTSLGRPVAIKVVRPELAQDPRFLQIFQREAQAQANVVHSHVLQAYFVGEEAGIWFLAMQIVEGGTLEEVLVRGELLSWKDAARHMNAVVAGMAEAARLGIVHRDIKPANILLDRAGEAHLADFGLATSTGLLPTADGPSTGPNSRKPGSTHAGAIMGTLEYMPPEQLDGKPLDERADIYAIGASFYQLLTGRLPYAVTDIPSTKAAHQGPPPEPLRKLRPEVPRGFAKLIDRCLSRDASARPASHAELLGILAKVGPRPEVRPSAIVRGLSLILDLVPFAVAFWPTYLRAPGKTDSRRGLGRALPVVALRPDLAVGNTGAMGDAPVVAKQWGRRRTALAGAGPIGPAAWLAAAGLAVRVAGLQRSPGQHRGRASAPRPGRLSRSLARCSSLARAGRRFTTDSPARECWSPPGDPK